MAECYLCYAYMRFKLFAVQFLNSLPNGYGSHQDPFKWVIRRDREKKEISLKWKFNAKIIHIIQLRCTQKLGTKLVKKEQPIAVYASYDDHEVLMELSTDFSL